MMKKAKGDRYITDVYDVWNWTSHKDLLLDAEIFQVL